MGAGEILLILLVVLLLFGAERLPSIARSLGKTMEELRRTAKDFTRDIMDGQQAPSASETPPISKPSAEQPPDERKG